MTTAGAVLASFRKLPHGGLNHILRGGTPFILAPHPDDEVIGCGGLLASASQAGIAAAIVFVTDGSGSHPNSRAFPRGRLVELRQREAAAAARILGVDLRCLHFIGIRDTAAPCEGPELTSAVSTILGILAAYPNPVIFAPWAHDPHGDHQAVAEMASRVARISGARHLSYVVWGWTLPETRELGFVDVTGWRFQVKATAEVKSRALFAHKSQTSDLIGDDPTGFRLDGAMLDAMLSDDEVFLLNS